MNKNLLPRDIGEAKKKLFEKMVMVINRTPLAYEIKRRFIYEISQDFNHQILRLTTTANEYPKLSDLQKLAKGEGFIEGINFTLGIKTFEQLEQYRQHFNICIKKAASEIENSYEVDDLSYLESTKNTFIGIAYNNQYCFQGDVTRSNESALNFYYQGIDNSKDRVNKGELQQTTKILLTKEQTEHLFKNLKGKFISSDTKFEDFKGVFCNAEIKRPIVWVDWDKDINRERLYSILVFLLLLEEKESISNLDEKRVINLATEYFRKHDGTKFNPKSLRNRWKDARNHLKDKQSELYTRLKTIIDTMPEK